MQQYTCPKCGAIGASPGSSPVPKCHKCDYKVFMKKSSNGVIIPKTEQDKDSFDAFKDSFDAFIAEYGRSKAELLIKVGSNAPDWYCHEYSDKIGKKPLACCSRTERMKMEIDWRIELFAKIEDHFMSF